MKEIDVSTWNRRTVYEYFSTFPNPCFSLTVNMDVTELVKRTKTTGSSFFVSFVYLLMLSINEMEEMRTRVVDGKVVVFDKVDPSFTVMCDSNDAFVTCDAFMKDSFRSFYNDCKSRIEAAKRTDLSDPGMKFHTEGLFSWVYITCYPWIELCSMTESLPYNQPDSLSIPRIAWGKYHEDNGRIKMMVCTTVSHTVCDGYPVARMFHSLQDKLDHAAELLV